ncbi:MULTISPECIES: carboxymuconolactone decarboxylase family protein [unclassified Pseudactinotalea]|uniref:carboxymuconolactone decarboxylase family protein n=1 Tax=unclassified Pseudactinotalea TaxID=2649176 RepID=UPI00128C6251|nr:MULTISPECIES: carboxymuconolactone decarboxylase family protein [unclassified Pseudactinotalea]MPV48463.1 carboxymuconolactone decarboxylase family protein [Pseudactinotalea sp. HY160]QGH68441.1 carboxymuconolactone decarboxylase family protein [Pseudactinotalea sp. HY158]
MSIRRVNPAHAAEAFAASERLGEEAKTAALAAGLDLRAIELIRLRCSQLNGCAMCLKAHTAAALAAGETVERIGVLTAWRETRYFSDVERACLELAEAVTLVAQRHLDDDGYTALAAVLAPEQISAATWVAIAINDSNRIWIHADRPVHPPREQPSGS